MNDTKRCSNCNRAIAWPVPPDTKPYQIHEPIEFCYVVHAGYGCDTGCCGHSVYGGNSRHDEVCHRFEFSHPNRCDGDLIRWARDIAAQVFPNVRFDEARCEVLDD